MLSDWPLAYLLQSKRGEPSSIVYIGGVLRFIEDVKGSRPTPSVNGTPADLGTG